MKPGLKKNDEDNRVDPDTDSKSVTDRKRPDDFARYLVLTSTPYIVIAYPLVGFALGYLPVHYWGWPVWFPVITMVLGLIQGMREAHRIGSRIDNQ